MSKTLRSYNGKNRSPVLRGTTKKLSILPEALRTKCGRCSNAQKEAALKVLKKLYVYYPKYYNDLRTKWDQTGEYHRRFEEYLREEQFNSISGDTDRDQTQLVEKTSPQFPVTPPASTTVHQISTLDTQRPARNPDEVQSNPSINQFDLFNRFGEDDDNEQTAPIPSVQSPFMSAPQQHSIKTPSTNPTYLPPFMNSSSIDNTNSFSTVRPTYPSVTATKGISTVNTVTNQPVTERMSSTPTPPVAWNLVRNCSPTQAQNAQKLTNFLQTRYPDVWAMLIRKYRGV
ncbi:hypothetical protein Bhyg_07763 [Pseudolycoriella hygida]|uniref:Uncharacterized protein n=1 Tax=Pseudolycoriella hygida TaxID=35572 RepID=A0A9Q0S314_9DIPT|nr:hypothetical protein Bhyg_07763 [Pseudolycoriella hygida]